MRGAARMSIFHPTKLDNVLRASVEHERRRAPTLGGMAGGLRLVPVGSQDDPAMPPVDEPRASIKPGPGRRRALERLAGAALTGILAGDPRAFPNTAVPTAVDFAEATLAEIERREGGRRA